MKTNTQQGFIPLVVAIVIGILAVAGGTAAIVMHQKKPTVQAPEVAKPEAPKQAVTTAPAAQKAVVPVAKEKAPSTASMPAPKAQAEKQPESVPVTAPVKPGVALIDAFLKNPTLESLKAFCSHGKQVEGTEDIKVMNADRTAYTTRKKTLYEQMPTCALALGEAKGSGGYQWVHYGPDYLLPVTDTAEPDKVRKMKLDYNAKLSAVPPYTLIGYDASFSEETGPVSPRRVAEYLLQADQNPGRYRIFLLSFTVPERQMAGIRAQLLQN